MDIDNLTTFSKNLDKIPSNKIRDDSSKFLSTFVF